MRTATVSRPRAVALILAGAALARGARSAGAQSLTPLHVAAIPTENAAAPYYAKDLGFFAKAGLDVDIQSFNGAAAIVAAVVSGAIDVGYGTIDVLAGVHVKGVPLIVLAPAAEYAAPDSTKIAAVVVPAGSAVRQAKDLNGKTVASNGLHSFGEDGLRVWLDQNGADTATMKFVELPFPAMPAALETGRVDAVFVTEPFVAAAAKAGRIIGYGYDGIAKHFLLSAWFTTPQWAKEHPDLAKRFSAVMHDTNLWANANQAKTAEIIAKYMKLDPALVASMVRARYADQITPALMQPVVDVSAKYNGFKSFPAQELLSEPAR